MRPLHNTFLGDFWKIYYCFHWVKLWIVIKTGVMQRSHFVKLKLPIIMFYTEFQIMALLANRPVSRRPVSYRPAIHRQVSHKPVLPTPAHINQKDLLRKAWTTGLSRARDYRLPLECTTPAFLSPLWCWFWLGFVVLGRHLAERSSREVQVC